MLTDDAKARIPQFKQRRRQILNRIAGIPGIQLVVTGHQVMLVRSTDDFYEGVVVLQLPHVVIERTGSRKNPVRRDMANANKPFEKRDIGLDNHTIDAILAAWSRDESAMTVDGVTHAFDSKGTLRDDKGKASR